jgi:hypothetical protein
VGGSENEQQNLKKFFLNKNNFFKQNGFTQNEMDGNKL